ncbi:MAG: UDP-N-acetylmuramoyl-L-alanyl-D-glutamate--2,6-diaminopimelate ligase [Trueperaceae bacterium]
MDRARTAFVPPPMNLGQLLADASRQAPALFHVNSLPSEATRRLFEVTGVAQDHRLVEQGNLFVARRGAKFDAHTHLATAVAAGAVALVGERPQAEVGALGAPYVRVTDARRALPYLAAAFYRHPSESMRVVGVTGTDGKTTTSYLTHWLLGGAHLAALSSTAGSYLGEHELPPSEGHFTTPEATEVQALLARFVAGGASHAVLESSSHGFALHRLDAVKYAVGVFTNLASEHMDFHLTKEAYAEAKATLMRRAPLAIINRDDPAFGYFAGAAAGAVITYGEHAEADVRLVRVEPVAGALDIELSVHGQSVHTHLPMVGLYNAHNAAAAVAVAEHEGVPLPRIVERLAAFPGVPGRMQLVAAQPTVIVDFAHTAPALAKALAAVRRQQARLIVVVGSAGERDATKRAPLGRAAVEGADFAIFTEEDSRSEDVSSILAEMAAGAAQAGAVEGADFRIEPDRTEAIRQAVALAGSSDVVLLAGKGHERTLERANETIQWDEADVARRAVAWSGGTQ